MTYKIYRDLSNTLITEDNSNNEYLFKDTLEKCNLQNTPLCNNILNNEITNSSLPKLCLNSCGKYYMIYI